MMHIDHLSAVHTHTVAAEDSLLAAARIMRDREIGSLPVLKGERLVGIITDRDIAMEVLCEARDPQATTVGEVASVIPVSAEVGTSIAEATHDMRRSKVRRLPIVTETGRLISIVTHDAALRRLAERLGRIGETLAMQEPDSDRTTPP